MFIPQPKFNDNDTGLQDANKRIQWLFNPPVFVGRKGVLPA